MATEAEHHAKYAECRAVLNGLPALITISPAWAATVAFYAAVHLIERLAARDNRHHTRHAGLSSRNYYITSHPNHQVIAADFMALYSASLVARYEPLTAFTQAYPGTTVQTQLIDGCLVRIENYLASVFPSPPPPTTGS